MDGHSNTGGWKDLVVGSVTTSIQKYDDEDTILITAGPTKKKAIIVDSEGKMKGREVGMYFSHTSTTKHYPFKSPLAQKIDNARISSDSDSDSEASSSAASEHDTETEEVNVVETLLEEPRIGECEKETRCEVRQMHRVKTLILP